jgi:hypothetical protein
MKLLKQVSAVVCAAILFACSGCSGTVAISPQYTYNTGTGASTIGASGTFTWKFGSSSNATFQAEVDSISQPTYTFVESIPSVFTSTSSTPPNITITATTDTGYTSSVTLALQSATTTVAPVNQGDVIYAYSVPASTALTTWEQDVEANYTSQVAIAFTTSVPFASNGAPGTYPFTTIVQTPDAYAAASGSAVILASGPGKCPGNPSCPVRPYPGE